MRTLAGDPYVLQLWGGYHPPVGILGVTHPEAAQWFVGRLRELIRMGANVFKTDFGEGVPFDAVAHDGTSGSQLHNRYTLVYNDLVADVAASQTGGPGLVWGRSTYTGGQRHAAQWGGDPNCSYTDLASTLRGGLSLSTCGARVLEPRHRWFQRTADTRPVHSMGAVWHVFTDGATA